MERTNRQTQRMDTAGSSGRLLSQSLASRTLTTLVAVLAMLTLAVTLTACSGSSGTTTTQTTTTSAPAPSSEIVVRERTSEYTWDELARIAQEISAAQTESAGLDVAARYHLVSSAGQLDGSQTKDVSFTDGTVKTAMIAGFNHDTKSLTGDKAGITFILKDSIGDHVMNNTETDAGGWEASGMRSYVANTVYNSIEPDLIPLIATVDKRTNNVGQSRSVSCVTTTQDKVWLPSMIEVAGVTDWEAKLPVFNDIYNSEGSQYQLYRNMHVNYDSKGGILTEGQGFTGSSWWLRSPNPNRTTAFRIVDASGDAGQFESANRSLPYHLGFCL